MLRPCTYTAGPKVCEHLLIDHLIPKSRALIWSWSPLCCYNSLHSSGKEAVWNSIVSVATEDRRVLHASALSGPVLWTCVAYHFTAEPLLSLSTFLLHNSSTHSWPGQVWQGRNLMNWLVGKVASYGATLKVPELFSKAILLPMFVYGDCMAVCSVLYTCHQRLWLK
jgi:hypothetical protein